MPKKKEKIIEQVFKADLLNEDKQLPLLKDLDFLENIKFHSVVRCESKGKERRGRRIVLLPRHMKELLNSFDEGLKKERRLFANDRKEFVREQNHFFEEQKRFDHERRSFANEYKKLQKEIKQLEIQNKALSEQHDALNKVNDQLRKNIEDKSLDERNRPKYPSGYSPVFYDAASQLHGLPVQGGAPG